MSEDHALKACVMGFPVSHSLSPKLHGWWLQKYGIDGAYTSMAVDVANLKDAFTLLKERGFRGCNLTLPLKESALSMMDEHDESCLMSGAVNTVVIDKGRLHGYNSDGFGFAESLTAQAPGWNGERVVILGTGGAARGIIASLRGAGAKHFVLVNRTPEKADKIVKAFKLESEVYAWDQRHEALKDATLLVNCSNLGMKDQPALDLSLDTLPAEAVVADIVYRPLETGLLKKAKARGNKTVEGLGMLLHQGRLGFGHWFGRDPEVTPELYKYMEGLAA
ncbi:MAG: shikimate dehydrogenase [Alphaproteobacteria bacterium]